jgi:orotate phosphoribosyltransferase
MDPERVLELLRESGGMLEGHFELSSGNHSDRYFQCARVLQHPERASELARAVADAAGELRVQVVVGPAMGAVVWSFAVAAALGVRSLFTERVDGAMALRRGFELAPGERVLVVEDALTTGGSAREAIAVVRAAGATPVGVAAIVNRSGGNPFEADGLRLVALCDVRAETWKPSGCPRCAAGGAAVKPGSRPGAPTGA